MPEVPQVILTDAEDRGWRTLLQGLAIDMATAIVLSLAVLMSGIDWTWAFWGVIGSNVAKSVIQSVVAYFMRLLVKPKIDIAGR